MILNDYVIELCADLMEDQIGDISDLPKELANTIANIYFKHYYYIIYHDSDTNKIIIPDEVKEAKDLMLGMEKHVKNRILVDKAFKSLPDIIDVLRDIEEEDVEQYNLTIELMLDIFKYNIDNAINKSSIRRKIERKFCKVNEIPDLIDMMYRK